MKNFQFSYFWPEISQRMEKTLKQYDKIMEICHEMFVLKMTDYGTAWRIMRPSSVTDQIYIKARRIRNIEEKGVSEIEDDIRSEFIGIINYAIIGLIQICQKPSEDEMKSELTLKLFHENFALAKKLLQAKNTDYGEAWRNMRISSYTDLILMKIKRTKQIEDKNGLTLASEGIEANYLDMINYAVFALIKLEFESNTEHP
jgi:hypothetical protein